MKTQTLIITALLLSAILESNSLGQIFGRKVRRSHAPHCAVNTPHNKEAHGSVPKPDNAAAPLFIQPQYPNWNQLKLGMTEQETQTLLGPPIKREPIPSDPRITHYRWMYGVIDFEHPQVPQPLHFWVMFKCSDRTIGRIVDPFQRQLLNSSPGIPTLVNPPNNTIYSHVPRFVDLRWTPAPGRYPLTYQIHVQVGQPVGRDQHIEWIDEPVLSSSIPYITWVHPGRNPGRWRVRAVDETGFGLWTDYHSFSFSK